MLYTIGLVMLNSGDPAGRMPRMTDPDLGPAVQRVIIGAELLAARTAAGLSVAAATNALGWHTGKLTRIEQGAVPVREADLDKCFEVYKVPRSEHKRLRNLAALGRHKLPPSRVPEWASRYVHLISGAASLKLFSEGSWPGTVQTLDYAKAQLRKSATVRLADVERMAEERWERVERLRSTGRPHLWLIVGEGALRKEIGGRETLRTQLELVLELAELPNVDIQVIPFDAGAHAADETSFSIINVIDGLPGIVLVGHLSGADYLGGEHVRVYNVVFDSLRASALSPERTMEVIARRIEEL
jgi:transcriptional regulator with XRE-family HTH domain